MANPLASSSDRESNCIPLVAQSVDLNVLATRTLRDAIALSEKADRTLSEWQQKYCPSEPVLATLEDCVELFVQSQKLSFPDDLFEESEEYCYPENRKSATRCGSAVAEVSPEQQIEALSQQGLLEEALELAHSEDIEEWIAIVDQALRGEMSLRSLQQKTGLGVVKLWIALLFGEFQLEREGDFYEGQILVSHRTLRC
jgi:hypothetical protein